MRKVYAIGLMILFAAFAVPAQLSAQSQQGDRNAKTGGGIYGTYGRNSIARDNGYQDGVRIGQDDAQRGRAFNFQNSGDYRNADAGYRSQYGNRDLYRSDFRLGFEQGYRDGYSQNSNYGYGTNRGNLPPWSNGRGRARGRGPNIGGYPGGAYPGGVYSGGNTRGYYDLASDNGYTDGYDQGLNDGRHNRRNDPLAQSRYRSGDHNYTGSYGSREAYRQQYRVGFRDGYERGYSDGRYYR